MAQIKIEEQTNNRVNLFPPFLKNPSSGSYNEKFPSINILTSYLSC